MNNKLNKFLVFNKIHINYKKLKCFLTTNKQYISISYNPF